jgi:hypothetical protein
MSPFKPIFIIGAARSGTSMLRDLIAGHPSVDLVPYDINYIWRMGNENLRHDELSPQSLSLKQVQRVKKQVARYHSGSPYLIEKTVSNCLRVPFVKALYPDGRIIQLVRNGNDVIESAYRQWLASPGWQYLLQKSLSYPFLDAFGYASSYAWGLLRKKISPHNNGGTTWGPRYRGIDEDLAAKSILEVCAIQWDRCVQAAGADLAHLPPGEVMTVVYEEFVQQPDKNMARIADFLGLDPSPFEFVLSRTAISTERVGTAEQALEQEQLAVLQPYIEKSMRLLNYA